MKLRNEFTVAAPLDRAWKTLLDIERVAGFLPGTTIEPSGEEGVFNGSMRVKLGPMLVNYSGTARLGATDEEGHTADIEVQAQEVRGQGTAAAVIHNKLVPVDGKTQVIAETDLQVTGRQAQFGRGIMQDVAGRMLDDFARRFERYLVEGEAPPAPPVAAGARAEETARGTPREPPLTVPASLPAGEEPEAFDLGGLLTKTAAFNYAAGVAGALSLLMTLALRRRRRGVTVKVSHSW